MYETAVERRIGVRAQDIHALQLLALHPGSLLLAAPAGQVADRAGDHGHLVTLSCQIARQFVVARAARLIQGSKGLVDQQDVHATFSFPQAAASE